MTFVADTGLLFLSPMARLCPAQSHEGSAFVAQRPTPARRNRSHRHWYPVAARRDSVFLGLQRISAKRCRIEFTWNTE